MSIKTIIVGGLETNCYLVADDELHHALVIDPGAEPEKILSVVESSGFKVTGIVNTHGHADHIAANSYIKSHCGSNPPIYIHREDAYMLTDPAGNLSSAVSGYGIVSPSADRLLNEGDMLSVGSVRMNVIHTPGHTRGGICLVCGEEFVICGDTLFKDSIGRCDLPGGDEDVLMKSLKRFRKMPKKMLVYPGHGPSTDIKAELKHNPFLR